MDEERQRKRSTQYVRPYKGLEEKESGGLQELKKKSTMFTVVIIYRTKVKRQITTDAGAISVDCPRNNSRQGS